MVNYKNAKIYTIRSYQTDKVYIGSTCNELRKRLWGHKASYKDYLNSKRRYISSFEIVKYDDAYIELYEKYECNDKIELLKREGEIIRQLKCVNKIQPSGNYLLLGKNKYHNEYNEKNKELIKQKRMIKIKCECGNLITKWNFARHNKSLKHRIFMFNLHNEFNHL